MDRKHFTPLGFLNFSCRICLERDPTNLVPISERFSDNKNLTICEVIEYCTQVSTTIYDILPQYICRICLERLRTAHKIKNLYISTSNILRKSSEDIENVMNLKMSLSNNSNQNIFNEFFSNNSATASDDSKTEKECEKPSDTHNTPDIDFSNEPDATSNPGSSISDQLSFVCNKCRISFDSLASLNLHHSMKHPQRQSKSKAKEKGSKKKIENQCNICKMILPDRSSLMLHRKTEHPEIWKYTCPYPDCHKSFNQKMLMAQHVNVVHLLIKKFECIKCRQKFGQRAQLNKHACSFADIQIES